MTGPLLFGVGASFLAGSFGYVLFQFWLKPLIKYRRVKRRVVNALEQLALGEAGGAGGAAAPSGGEDRSEAIRKLAVDLSACYNEHLPDWYQLLLERRLESPLDAAAYLMKLANTRNPGHAARQIENIRKSLNVIHPVGKTQEK